MAREIKVKNILDMIGTAESDSAGGYNALVGDKKGIEGLTDKTIGEILKIQKQRIKEGKNSAIGRYQIINNTLRDTYKKAGLTEKDLFSPENQDRLGETLLEKRGLSKYLKGKIDSTTFGNKLSKEWAGLPILKDIKSKKRGQSYYKGVGDNKSIISPETVERILQKIIPGAEGAEINEENMARFKRLDEREKKKEQEKSQAPSPEFTADFLSGMDKDLGIKSKEEQQIPFRPTESPFRKTTEIGVEDRETIPEVDFREEPPQNKEEEDKKGMEDGFRDALLYFGPRLGAMLVGGTDALEITDKTLKGFEESKRASKMSPFEEAKIEDSQADRELRREEIGARQQAAQAQAVQEAQKSDEVRNDQLDVIEQTLRDYAKANKFLTENKGTTGYESIIGGGISKVFGTQLASNRKLLQELRVDAVLKKVALTKGAISDREMKIFESAVPTLTDQETVWKDFFARKALALQSIQNRLKKGIVLPENQRASDKRIQSYLTGVERMEDKDKSTSIKGAGFAEQETERNQLERLRKQKADFQR